MPTERQIKLLVVNDEIVGSYDRLLRSLDSLERLSGLDTSVAEKALFDFAVAMKDITVAMAEEFKSPTTIVDEALNDIRRKEDDNESGT